MDETDGSARALPSSAAAESEAPYLQDPVARFAADVLRQDDVVFDIGANRGNMTRVFAPRARQVIAFEPNPALAAAVRALALPNVQVVERAVSSAPGRLPFYLDVRAGTQGLASSLMRLDGIADGEVERIEVEVTTIDAFARETGLYPDFVKVDVEGFEPEVLAGAEEVIGRSSPIMVLELWESHWPRYREAMFRLAERYEITRASDRRPVLEVYEAAPMGGMDNIICIPRRR